jgi:predicted acetyltransferase
MNIEKGNPALTAGIKELWNICFPQEDPRYAEFFFRSVYQPEYSLAAVDGSRVVASLIRVPHVMMFNGRPLSTSMILGVCTLPQYQHQGLMHALMKIALDETEHTELVTLLQAYDPAVYQPFGFETIYRRSELVVRSEDFKRITNFGCAYEPSPVDMLKVYSAFIRRFNGFYARDLKYFEDYKKEITAEGGKIIAYYDGKNIIRGYEAILPDGLELNVEEIVYLDGMSLFKLVNAALQERPVIHLHVSASEALEQVLPVSASKTYGSTMARLNDAQMFSRMFQKKVGDVKSAFALSRKPLNLNENR